MWTYPEDCANKRETHSWLLPQMHHMTLSATYVFSSTNETQQTEFKAPSFAIAGLCDNGTCMWPSTLEEEEKAHPEMYHHCPDRLNTAKMYLFSCYYTCNISDQWYYGFYNFSSYCRMYENPEEIGRCCKGECTKNTTCDYSWKLTT
nr:uncharacterized protein LOC129380649 isoform X3 [Dermacentor andersoni]